MKRMLPALFGLCTISSAAFADGPGPARKMTDPELANFNTLRAVVQEALPKPPAGYAFSFEYRSDYEEGAIPEALAANEKFGMIYNAQYTRDAGLDAQQMMNTFMNRAQGTPEQQAKKAELDAKEADLMEARDKAKSPAEKDRVRAELKAVRAESDKLTDEIASGYEAWMAAGGAATAMQDFSESAPAKELTINVRINHDESLNEKAAPVTVAGGYPAYEQASGCHDGDFYCITVFLGRFAQIKKNAGYTDFKLEDVDLGVPTKPRGMVVTFTGPEDKPEAVRELVRGTNWASLKAVLP